MSEFGGRLKEYNNISIDLFDGKQVAQAYFLSHCHKDHMVGLESSKFVNILKTSKHVFLHCSQTTFNLLMCSDCYGHLRNYIRVLPLEQPTLIPLCDEVTDQHENVTVTLLSAGHCVGSVMFLFEGKYGTVLYTGDFRLSKGDSKRIDYFHVNGCVKPVESVYVDTTFCIPKMASLPSREESRDAIISLADRWFSRGPNHVVSLLCKGMYGYEFILKELALHYKTKIHVSQERLSLYRNLPDMSQHFTTDGKATQLHACKWEKTKKLSDLPCGSNVGCHPGTLKVLKIKPTTLWFARQSQPLPPNHRRYCPEKQMWRVVHSMHASMDEIRDMVGYLRPYHVHANVRPAGLDSLEDAVERLKDLVNRDKQSKPLRIHNSGEEHLHEKHVRQSVSSDTELSPHTPIAAKARPSNAGGEINPQL